MTTSRRRLLGLAPLVALLSGCGRLDELVSSPPTTPEQWCQQRPCVDLGATTLTEPLGTALVAALTLAWIASGVYFLVTRAGQRSRAWFGVALLLGGVGAGLAGVSYQAFSYPLKCAGWDYCRLTNEWEVGFSVAQAASVGAMVVSVAYACTRGRARRVLSWYAALNVAVYLVVTALGVLVPSALLLSFEVLMLFAVPGIVIVLVVAGRRYRRERDPLSRSLLVAAGLLVLVQAAYFAYYAAGTTATLWNEGRGFYFSANDVLHVGLLGWLTYVVVAVGRRLRDLREEVG